MKRYFMTTLVLCVAVLLSACGGGGGGINQIETGAPATIRSAIEGIAATADSLLVSDAVGILRDRPVPGGDPSPGPRAFRSTPVCRTTTSCSLSAFGVAVPVAVSTFRSLSTSLRFTEAGSRQGVPLAEGRSRTNQQGVTTSALVLGGWLDHNFFAAHREEVTGGSTDAEFSFSYSIGDATGTTPSGNATWTGGMTGLDVSATANNGNRIHGDATITFDVATTDLDVAFTNVRDLDAGGVHPNMQWANVPVEVGRFGAGSRGNSIQGQFYGPNHEEVGGTFERNQLVGAFGAKR